MISLLAAIMSIAYSTIAIGLAGHEGKQANVQYNLDGFTKPNGVFGVLNTLGTVAFAYGGGRCAHAAEPDGHCSGLLCSLHMGWALQAAIAPPLVWRCGQPFVPPSGCLRGSSATHHMRQRNHF